MATFLTIAAALLAFPAAMYLMQDRLLYFPEPATVEQVVPAGLRAWPSPEDFRGLVAEPDAPARATAIVFHGNAGHAGHRAFYARALVPLGVRVVLAEYPGYGPRDGKPGERAFVADAIETVERVHRDYGGRLVLVGESLGAAVAAAAGAHHRERVAGLLLVTPWDRLANVGAHHYRWLPVQWMLRDRYDNVQSLSAFDRPIVVAVAAQDRIVPARFGSALHDALQGPRRLVVIEGSDHNDWPVHVDPGWWRDVIDFALSGTRVR